MTAVAPSTSSRRRLSSPWWLILPGRVCLPWSSRARDPNPRRKVPAERKALRPYFKCEADAGDRPDPGMVARHWLVWSADACHQAASIAFNLPFTASSWLASMPSISRASAAHLPRSPTLQQLDYLIWSFGCRNAEFRAWPQRIDQHRALLTSKSRTPSIVSAACCSAV